MNRRNPFYFFSFFFFNDTATTEIYTLSLHDALPISSALHVRLGAPAPLPLPCGSVEPEPGRAALSAAARRCRTDRQLHRVRRGPIHPWADAATSRSSPSCRAPSQEARGAWLGRHTSRQSGPG